MPSTEGELGDGVDKMTGDVLLADECWFLLVEAVSDVTTGAVLLADESCFLLIEAVSGVISEDVLPRDFCW